MAREILCLVDGRFVLLGFIVVLAGVDGAEPGARAPRRAPRPRAAPGARARRRARRGRPHAALLPAPRRERYADTLPSLEFARGRFMRPRCATTSTSRSPRATTALVPRARDRRRHRRRDRARRAWTWCGSTSATAARRSSRPTASAGSRRPRTAVAAAPARPHDHAAAPSGSPPRRAGRGAPWGRRHRSSLAVRGAVGEEAVAAVAAPGRPRSGAVAAVPAPAVKLYRWA